MPTAPPTRCGAVGCYQFATGRGRCEEHQPQPWAGRPSLRERYGLSGGALRTLKRRVAERDHGCCYICGGEGADELDHIIPVSQGGAAADLDNLGLAHAACHRAKSAAEAQAGRTKRAKRT